MSFDYCMKKGLIKKNLDAKKRVERELVSANKFLNSSKNIIKIDEFDSAFLSAYNSCFHFLRALLFYKGYIEKSHYCLIEALKSLYSNEKILLELLETFDKIRQARHEIQYGGIFSDMEEVEHLIKLNEKIKTTCENILNKKA